jgi:hypothetical protein
MPEVSLRRAERRGYPLGALFVLVTLSAVLVAGITPLVRKVFAEGTGAWEAFGAMAAGATAGAIVGMVVGALEFRRGMGVLMGGGVGTLLGGAAGLMAMLPAGQIATAAVAMLVGSSLVVGVAVLMRRSES